MSVTPSHAWQLTDVPHTFLLVVVLPAPVLDSVLRSPLPTSPSQYPLSPHSFEVLWLVSVQGCDCTAIPSTLSFLSVFLCVSHALWGQKSYSPLVREKIFLFLRNSFCY